MQEPIEFEPINTNSHAFLELLVGTRRLIRRDIPGAGLRGLLDSETREWFVIEESRLFTRPAELLPNHLDQQP